MANTSGFVPTVHLEHSSQVGRYKAANCKERLYGSELYRLTSVSSSFHQICLLLEDYLSPKEIFTAGHPPNTLKHMWPYLKVCILQTSLKTLAILKHALKPVFHKCRNIIERMKRTFKTLSLGILP